MGLSNVKRTPCSTADDALQILAMVRDLVLMFTRFSYEDCSERCGVCCAD